MPLLEQIIRLYAPHSCLGCAAETDRLLCEDCAVNLPVVPSRCYRCKAVTREYAVCYRCSSKTSLSHVYVSQPHEGLAKELMHTAKYERARAGLQEMVERMTPLLSDISGETLVVPIPTATSRVRQRGYDQAKLLSRGIANALGLRKANVLRRLGQAHQVGASRKQRLEHLKDAFRVVAIGDIQGAHLLLVDDVVTTGATVETAAKLLKQAGAAKVDAIVFSQPS